MTWTPMSSPTRRAAAAPASVAAFTDPTSPRTIAVTRPASTFCQPTNTTLAVLHIASAASIIPTRPRVSTRPSASPISRLSFSAIILRNDQHRTHRDHGDKYISVCSVVSVFIVSRDFPAGRDRQRVDDAIAFDQAHDVDQVGHHARMVRH